MGSQHLDTLWSECWWENWNIWSCSVCSCSFLHLRSVLWDWAMCFQRKQIHLHIGIPLICNPISSRNLIMSWLLQISPHRWRHYMSMQMYCQEKQWTLNFHALFIICIQSFGMDCFTSWSSFSWCPVVNDIRPLQQILFCLCQLGSIMWILMSDVHSICPSSCHIQTQMQLDWIILRALRD